MTITHNHDLRSMCSAFISKFISILRSVFNKCYQSESPSQFLRIEDKTFKIGQVLDTVIVKTRSRFYMRFETKGKFEERWV